MDKVNLDSGFGYHLNYPLNGELKIFCSIKKSDGDRIIILEYLPEGPFRRILQSNLIELDWKTQDFVYSMISVIDSGICDTENSKVIELYSDE